MSIKERFKAVNEEFLAFDNVENKRSKMPDLHAFLLLENLFPDNKGDIIVASEHDVIYLNFNDTKIETLSDKNILELTRCGVLYSSEDGYLFMFT